MEKEAVEKLVDQALQKHCKMDEQKHEELKNIFLDGMKELGGKVDDMAPTVKDIKDFATFFRVGKQVGLGTALIVTTFGIIAGAIYALKEWIKK